MQRQIIIVALVAAGCSGNSENGSENGGGKVDPCEGQTCSDHGECRVTDDGHAVCECQEGYQDLALTCVANCMAVDCGGLGGCIVVDNEPVCVCDQGYKGVGLECRAASTCLNITCSGHGSCVKEQGEPVCICEYGYAPQGLDCIPSSCAGVRCTDHGACQLNEGAPSCHCDPGYMAVGLGCVSDECRGDACSGRGACALVDGQMECTCDHGYVAVDDECRPAPCELEDCSNHGACVEGTDGLECICDPGYLAVGLSCRPRCSGVDCSGHGACVQDRAGIRCLCDPGYEAEGERCLAEGVPVEDGGLDGGDGALPVTDGGADSDSGVPISDGGATDGDSGSHGDGAPADGGDADSDDSGVDSGGVCADAGTRCLSGRISAFDPSWFERIEIGLLQIDDRLNVRIDDEHVIHDDTRSGAKGSFAMLASGRLLDDTGSVRRYEIALPRGDSLVPTSDGKYEYALLAWIDDDGDGEWDGIDSRETAGVSGSEVNGLPRSWFDAWQQTREHMTIYRFRTFASSIVNDPDNPWLMNIASPYTRRSGSSFSVRAEARIIDFRFLRADYGDALPLPSEPNTPGPSDETCTPLGSTSMCTVDLPGGTLQMGRRDGYPNDRPVHSVTIAPFTISKSEITVDQYQQCVDAGACTAATHWREDCNAELAEGAGDHPINCTTWYMAQDFATWIGGRLPTEAEWEWAASGAGAGTAYPWGNEPPDCTRVHMRVGVLADKGCGDNMTAPVCSLPAGHSPQGLCDLAGNVGEWVADDWHSDYERAPTDGSAWLGGGTVHKVRRGGTLDFESHFCAACRDQALPSAVHEDMGFRVVF